MSTTALLDLKGVVSKRSHTLDHDVVLDILFRFSLPDTSEELWFVGALALHVPTGHQKICLKT